MRYTLRFSIDYAHPGCPPHGSDDLQEAGRLYLADLRAVGIYDHVEHRYIDPEREVDVVIAANEAWRADHQPGGC